MVKKIQITKFPDSDVFQKQKLKQLIESHYDKLNKMLPGELMLEVHFKQSHKQGRRKLTEVRAKAVIGGIMLNSHHSGWEPEKLLLRVLTSLETEAKKIQKN